MAKRRNSDEICKQLHKDRSKLYRERSKLIALRDNGSFSSKRLSSNNTKIDKLSSKIESYKSKIFKCGKRYAKLKKYRASLIAKVNKMSRDIKGNRSLKSTEVNKMRGAMKLLNDDIRDLSKVMGKELDEQKRGKLTFTSNETSDVASENTVIWDAKGKIEGLIKHNEFDTLIIGNISDDNQYNLIIDRVAALFAVDDYITDIVASQRDGKVRTPMVEISFDLLSRTLQIK